MFRKRWKKYIAAALCIVTFSSSAMIGVSAAGNFEGWNDDNRMNVWDVYTITDWKSMKDDLVLGNEKSTTEAIQISPQVEALRSKVRKTLKGIDNSVGLYKNTSYTNLMLAMIQVVSNGNPDLKDPCQVRKYINPSLPEETMTAEKSIKHMFLRLVACEKAHVGETSIYRNDAGLQSVIQGVITLPDYTKKYKDYSSANAQEYISANKGRLHGDPSPYFAKEVAQHYRAVQVGNQYTGSGSTQQAQKIIDAAHTQLGVPYVWGGTKPYKGLDCSGLTQYCHKQAGIKIPRTSGEQAAGGKNVGSLSNAQPGDIICYPGHVAIYIGDNTVIHAPEPGKVVCKAPATMMKITTIRRYW